jgi:hypothetical protein
MIFEIQDSTGVKISLVRADFLSLGSSKIYMTAVIPYEAGEAWLSASVAPYSIITDGEILYAIAAIEWSKHRGSKRKSLVLTSRECVAQRVSGELSDIEIIKSIGGRTSNVYFIAGAVDIMVGDVINNGGSRIVVEYAQIHNSRIDGKCIVYG